MQFFVRPVGRILSCFASLVPLLMCAPNMAVAQSATSIHASVACTVLTAHLTPEQARQGNSAPDTQRIQQALSLCSPGKAVVLRADDSQSAFLSGPLLIPRAVTLFVDSGTTLFASRNLRDYDLAPASCGAAIRDPRIPQCKPLLFSYQAVFSGIAGNGTIDGQATVADFHNAHVSTPNLISVYESPGFHLQGVTLQHARGISVFLSKTGDLHASDLLVLADNANRAPAILLSNAQGGELSNLWVRAHGTALALRGSILGSTAGLSLHDLHFFEGGLSLGDPIYGNIKSITAQNISIANAPFALRFDLTGHKTGAIRNVQFANVCLSNVQQPVTTVTNSGITNTNPPASAIALNNVTSSGCGQPAPWPTHPLLALAVDTTQLAHPGTRSHLVVAQDGSGDFTSVQQAVDALPNSGGEILIHPGIYREVVTIRKPHVLLRGTGTTPQETILVHNSSPHDGGTFSTPTVFVEADNVTIENLTMSNDLGYGKGQAAAMWTNGDRDMFRNVRLLGHQDTLYASAKYCYGDYGPCVAARQYFANCYIAGNVDFIFGDSLAYFDHCELHGNPRGNVMFTAQSKHTAEQQSGYVFNECHLTADTRGDDGGSIALGRPWRPYSTVVFLRAQMDAAVIPKGWAEWPRFGVLSLPTAYYAEYESTGPGANPKAREPYSHQLTAAEAAQFTGARFLSGKDGWNPQAATTAAAH